MSTPAERLYQRFRASERAHGKYIPAKQKKRGEKKLEAADAPKTVPEPIQLDLWERHLKGTYGVGAIPITGNNTCHWGAIDIDDYELDWEALERDLARLVLPLIPCRSKSGGCHLYAFTSEPVPAVLMRRRLVEWAAALGRPGIEVFPKQERLSGPDDVGNWINMPYFGGAESTRHAIQSGRKLSVEEFLTLADTVAMTEGELKDFTLPEEGRLPGAPPCLQRLARGGCGEGGRNKALFNFGVYARKRHGDEAFPDKLEEYNQTFVNPPVGQKELAQIVKNVGKKDYGYTCKEDPIKSVCSRDVCLTREFGIGGGIADQGITPEAAPWPTPDPLMFHGLAGEFVRLVEPHTEADPVALLLQFLIASGNAIGRQAYYVVEGARHHVNLFGVLVGQTSKGRKGTSWQHAGNLMFEADQVWREQRISSGLSSGEGLIWAVRDAVTGTAPKKDDSGKKIAGQFEEVVIDAGVDDKRLLVMESEFASTLRVMKRDGSTLSAIIRQAWDSGDLNSLTKNSPAKATDAHISIVGHITADELRRELDRTEVANGFLNRFLLVCVRRSKLLPDGGSVNEGALHHLGLRVSERLRQFDFKPCDLKRDDAARERWHEVYPELSQGRPGLLGAVTSRSEAQVTRLACLYAVLDGSEVIRREHLEAGLALWRYVEDSARFLFKESLGDPDADTIIAALRAAPDGLTRTEINNIFGRNRPTERVDASLRLIEEQGLAVRQREETGGRPRERWVSAFGPFNRASLETMQTGEET